MDILLMITALIFVVCLMLAFAWGIQKLGFAGGKNILIPGQAKNLEILEQLALDPKRRLMLVKAGKKNYLLLNGLQGEQLIDTDVKIEENNEKK